MDREEALRIVLDHDLSVSDLDRLSQAMRVLGSNERGRETLVEYDRIRELLAPDDVDVEPQDGWDIFETRLGVSTRQRREHVVWKVTAVAASLLLALSLYRLAPHRSESGGSNVATAALAGLQFTPDEAKDRLGAFREITEVFDNRASWLLVADGASDLGLGAPQDASADQLLLVRLTTSRRGVALASADLVIVPGQTARVSVPCKGIGQLRYQIATSTGHPTRLTLWVEIQRGDDGGEMLAALATDLQIKPGDVLPAGEMVTSNGEYEVTVSFSDGAAQKVDS